MQRVHQDDLAGYLEEQGGFEILNLPAIATQTKTYELGVGRTYVRQQGELLHPAHEPVSVLLELKREMGPIAFSAQYQQSPIPPGGTIIKRKWLTTYDGYPAFERGRPVLVGFGVFDWITPDSLVAWHSRFAWEVVGDAERWAILTEAANQGPG